MAILNLKPNLSDVDRLYEGLMTMHRNLNEAQSQTVNARLILILSNHIGDLEVLEEAMTLAANEVRQSAEKHGS